MSNDNNLNQIEDIEDSDSENEEQEDKESETVADFNKSPFSEFLAVVSETAKNIEVCCKLCPKVHKIYKTSKSSKSNLTTHMKVNKGDKQNILYLVLFRTVRLDLTELVQLKVVQYSFNICKSLN